MPTQIWNNPYSSYHYCQLKLEQPYVYLIDYKDKNRLNNLSTVIERLVLERIFREQGKLDMNTNIDNKLKEKSTETKVTKLLNNIKSAMPD